METVLRFLLLLSLVLSSLWIVWLLVGSFPRLSPSQHLLSNCLVLIERSYNMVFWKVGFVTLNLDSGWGIASFWDTSKTVRMFLLMPWILKDCCLHTPSYLYELKVWSCNIGLSIGLHHHSCHFPADFPQVPLLLVTQAVSETNLICVVLNLREPVSEWILKTICSPILSFL